MCRPKQGHGTEYDEFTNVISHQFFPQGSRTYPNSVGAIRLRFVFQERQGRAKLPSVVT